MWKKNGNVSKSYAIKISKKQYIKSVSQLGKVVFNFTIVMQMLKQRQNETNSERICLYIQPLNEHVDGEKVKVARQMYLIQTL